MSTYTYLISSDINIILHDIYVAIEHYLLSLKFRPNIASTHYHIGLCLIEEGTWNLFEAITHFEKCATLKPNISQYNETYAHWFEIYNEQSKMYDNLCNMKENNQQKEMKSNVNNKEKKHKHSNSNNDNKNIMKYWDAIQLLNKLNSRYAFNKYDVYHNNNKITLKNVIKRLDNALNKELKYMSPEYNMVHREHQKLLKLKQYKHNKYDDMKNFGLNKQCPYCFSANNMKCSHIVKYTKNGGSPKKAVYHRYKYFFEE